MTCPGNKRTSKHAFQAGESSTQPHPHCQEQDTFLVTSCGTVAGNKHTPSPRPCRPIHPHETKPLYQASAPTWKVPWKPLQTTQWRCWLHGPAPASAPGQPEFIYPLQGTILGLEEADCGPTLHTFTWEPPNTGQIPARVQQREKTDHQPSRRGAAFSLW